MARWAHVISSFRGHWLPGDLRGFRSRKHRIHSSHDYRAVNPEPEHEELHRYAQGLAGDAIRLTRSQCRVVIAAIIEKMEAIEIPVAVIACDAVHCHALLRVGDQDAKLVFGRAKQLASFRLRDELPGRIWGASSHAERVHDLEQFERAVRYIWKHRSKGAEVWIRPDIAAACLKEDRDGKDPSLHSKTRSDSASVGTVADQMRTIAAYSL